MKLNIASVLKNDGASRQFSGIVELGTFDFMGSTLEFKDPLEVVGEVQNIGGALEISAKIQGEYFTSCSCCGRDVNEKLSLDLFESVPDDFSDVDEECISLSGTVLDISGSIEACIFNNLPMRFLCREDCKGLCPHCGIDLNKNECNCEDEVYDPRFAIFRKLSKEV